MKIFTSKMKTTKVQTPGVLQHLMMDGWLGNGVDLQKVLSLNRAPAAPSTSAQSFCACATKNQVSAMSYFYEIIKLCLY